MPEFAQRQHVVHWRPRHSFLVDDGRANLHEADFSPAGAVADVAEGAGSLARAVSFAAANATAGVTSTAARLASTSLTLAREAWVGVDLLNITANRPHGRVLAVISAWSMPGPRPSQVLLV